MVETTLPGVLKLFLAKMIQDFIQFTCPLKRGELIVSANNLIVYYDDRYRPPTELFHYFPFQFRVMGDINLLVVDLLFVEQSLRRTTIWTVSSCVNFNLAQCIMFLLYLLLS